MGLTPACVREKEERLDYYDPKTCVSFDRAEVEKREFGYKKKRIGSGSSHVSYSKNPSSPEFLFHGIPRTKDRNVSSLGAGENGFNFISIEDQRTRPKSVKVFPSKNKLRGNDLILQRSRRFKGIRDFHRENVSHLKRNTKQINHHTSSKEVYTNLISSQNPDLVKATESANQTQKKHVIPQHDDEDEITRREKKLEEKARPPLHVNQQCVERRHFDKRWEGKSIFDHSLPTPKAADRKTFRIFNLD